MSARDIIEMDAWKAKCPCCNNDLEIEWQLAVYDYGNTSPQFVGLKCTKQSSYIPYALRAEESIDREFNNRKLLVSSHRKRKIKTPPKPRPESLKNVKKDISEAGNK